MYLFPTSINGKKLPLVPGLFYPHLPVFIPHYTHIAGTVAQVSKTVIYGTVTGIVGEPTKCWLSSNLGADHQANSVMMLLKLLPDVLAVQSLAGFKHDGTNRLPNTPG